VRSDEELMADWIGGDERAFDQIFERYAPLLLRVMRRQLHRPEEARDLVQQTFLQLHRSRHDFQRGARLRPWLLTIAVNLKREHFRRVRRRPEAALDLDGRGDPAEGPRGAQQSDAARDLETALGRISPEQREVIELHWLEGLSFAEIAELVGAGLSAVKVRAHRGYLALRQVLEEAPAEGFRNPVGRGGVEGGSS
jgi:RNA polymerase sigma-70 factor (ECF subfamily)